jgi:hypothetical protein
MWGIILKFLTGGILDKLAAAYETKIRTDADKHKIDVSADQAVLLAQIQADTENRRAAAANRGPVWMVALFVIPYAFHNAAIVLDSMFSFAWKIEKLPAPFDATEHAVIWSVCGIAAGAVALKRIFSR